MYINDYGYLERKTTAGPKEHRLSTKRSTWLIKDYHKIGTYLDIPRKYIGKRIRLKVIIEEVGGVKDEKFN